MNLLKMRTKKRSIRGDMVMNKNVKLLPFGEEWASFRFALALYSNDRLSSTLENRGTYLLRHIAQYSV